MGRRMSEKASRPPAEAPTPATKKGGAAEVLALAFSRRLRFDALRPGPMTRSMPPLRQGSIAARARADLTRFGTSVFPRTLRDLRLVLKYRRGRKLGDWIAAKPPISQGPPTAVEEQTCERRSRAADARSPPASAGARGAKPRARRSPGAAGGVPRLLRRALRLCAGGLPHAGSQRCNSSDQSRRRRSAGGG